MREKSTTIAEFSHPDNDSMVALVGNRHYGSMNYMMELRARLFDYELAGAKIHFEGVRLLTEDQISELTKAQQRSYLALASLLDLSERMYSARGLVHVKSILRPSDAAWEHHDTTIDDLMRRATLGQRMALGVIGTMVKITNLLDEDDFKEAFDKAERTAAEKGPNRLAGLVMGTLNPLILDYRNGIALDAVDAALAVNPSQDLALLWGNAHVPGLGEGLTQRGYEQVSERTLDPFQ